MADLNGFRQTVSGLIPDKRYAIKVRSVDGLGNKSEWCEALEINVLIPDKVPVGIYSVSYVWGGLDLAITWNPVSSYTDGTPLVVSSYHVNMISAVDGSLLKKIPVSSNSTMISFSTYEEYLNDNDLVFYISVEDNRGVSSQFQPSQTVIATHTHNTQETPIPSLSVLGDSIIVTPTSVVNCVDSMDIQYSTDGDSWTTLDTEQNPSAYIYTPPSPGGYFIRVRYKDIFDQSFAWSDAAFATVV